MRLTLNRMYLKDDYTIGVLNVDGKYFCETLEDKVRDVNRNGRFDGGEQKVYGRTAIPYGTYRVTLKVQSPKYAQRPEWWSFCRGYMPRLQNVPDFAGILIHPGNTQDDTEGCILVGENKVKGQVINSKATFKRLYSALKAAERRGEEIWIDIR